MILNDLEVSIAVTALMFVMLIAMSAGLAHCMDSSSQANCEITRLYIKHKNPRLPKAIRDHIASEIITQSHSAGLPYEIVTAIIYIESNYNPEAIGPLGEIGLMQIYTMECGGVVLDKMFLHDIECNIAAGVCILLEKLQAADGDIIEAIRRYNGAGPSARKFRDKVCETIIDIFRFRVVNRSVVSDVIAGIRG